MKVTFLDSHSSSTFSADVEPYTTGETCISELVSAGFIPPTSDERPYTLRVTRTNQQLLANASMQDVGVMDNDSIAVLKSEQGAGVQFIQIQEKKRGQPIQ